MAICLLNNYNVSFIHLTVKNFKPKLRQNKFSSPTNIYFHLISFQHGPKTLIFFLGSVGNSERGKKGINFFLFLLSLQSECFLFLFGCLWSATSKLANFNFLLRPFFPFLLEKGMSVMGAMVGNTLVSTSTGSTST